jgi:AraC family transcriptional regulator
MSMGALEREPMISTAEIVAHAVGIRPVRWLEASTDLGLSAARWRFEKLPPIGGAFPLGMLSYRAAGSAWAMKVVDGRATRKRPKVGSVSFAPSNGRAVWSVEGAFEAVHVYLHPAAIQRVAEEQVEMTATPEIDDFFAVEDPWLAGYFQMLVSELEVRDPLDRKGDPLLVDQTEHLLVRHLLRWYRRGAAMDARAAGFEARANPLRAALMRRAEEYIHANLAGEISLALLARLSCMSVDNFLRSFRAACGLTPYQYPGTAAAQVGPRSGNTPIAAIALQCVSRTLAFLGEVPRFGVVPSRYRGV